MKKGMTWLMVLVLLLPLLPSIAGASESEAEPYTLTVGWARGANIAYRPGESVDDNAWMRAYRDAGINLEFKLMTVPDQYQQKLALAIAANDLPDLWHSDKKNFYLALEAGVVKDITDLYESELSQLSHTYMDEYDIPFRAATIDGRLMAIPSLDEDPTTDAQLTFIRHDWLDKLGLPVPSTQQEMVETMIAFAQKDPDGNGEADTIGFGIKKDLWKTQYGLEGFFNAYHAYPNIWYDVDGKLVYGTVQADAMKAGLADLARLYKEGAIDKEFIVKDGDKLGEDIVNQRVGVIYGRWWTFGTYPAKAFMADPEKVEDRWWCVDSVSIDEKPTMLQSISEAPNSFVVTNKDSEHPEAVFKLINMFYDLMFAPDLTQEQFRIYTVDEDVTPQSYSFVALWPYLNPRVPALKGVLDGTSDPGTFTGETAQIWENITAFKEKNYYQAAYDHYWNHSMEPHTSMQVRWDLMQRKGTVSNMDYGPSGEAMIQYMSTLEQMRDEVIVQIITGEKPVEAFDEFIANWYALGGEEIVNEINAWYDTTK